MATITLDLEIDQGSSFSQEFILTGPAPDYDPVDLTGYGARAQMRETADNPEIVAEFTCVVTPLEGKVTISLTPEETEGIPTVGRPLFSSKAKYTYDVEIFQGTSYVERISQGMAYVSPEVTR